MDSCQVGESQKIQKNGIDKRVPFWYDCEAQMSIQEIVAFSLFGLSVVFIGFKVYQEIFGENS
jgi:hypothetical protein